jgi:hypothetical protein
LRATAVWLVVVRPAAEARAGAESLAGGGRRRGKKKAGARKRVSVGGGGDAGRSQSQWRWRSTAGPRRSTAPTAVELLRGFGSQSHLRMRIAPSDGCRNRSQLPCYLAVNTCAVRSFYGSDSTRRRPADGYPMGCWAQRTPISAQEMDRDPTLTPREFKAHFSVCTAQLGSADARPTQPTTLGPVFAHPDLTLRP